jgi:hypothetical protein
MSQTGNSKKEFMIIEDTGLKEDVPPMYVSLRWSRDSKDMRIIILCRFPWTQASVWRKEKKK